MLNATDASSPSAVRLTQLLSLPKVVIPLLAFATLVLIWANWNAPFFDYDDPAHLKQGTDDSFISVIDYNRQETYFPVALLSMRIDRALFGPPFSQVLFAPLVDGAMPLDHAQFKSQILWATVSRLENALFHFLAAIVLWLFLKRIGASPGIAFFSAFAWAIHPMACESVCWISERKNVLSTLFGFAALLTWAAGRRAWWRWPLLCVFYLLSTLSKPTGVGLLPIFIALECINPPEGISRANLLKDLPRIAARLAGPLFITAFIVAIGMQAHQIVFLEHAGGSLFHALLTDLEIFSRYIGNLLMPVNLSFFYGIEPIRSIADSRVWLFGLCLTAAVAAPIWLSTGVDRRLAVLGIFWFFGALGPVSNIAPIPYWMHDRFVYISSAGLLLAFACGLKGALKRLQLERLLPVIASIFLVMLFAFSAARATVFTDSDLLSFDAAQKFPNSCFAQINAYDAVRYRIEQLGNVPGAEAAKARAYFIDKANEYYSAAIQRSDITNFREEFKFRVDHAELLVQLGKIDAALACLNGFLPPQRLKMRAPNQPFRGAEFKEFYAPQTLARAWLINAQACLTRANPPGVSLSALPIAQRFKLCDEAAQSLVKSLAAYDWNQQAPFLNAAVSLTRSEIAKLAGQPRDAAKYAADARAQLEALAPTSPYRTTADQILRNIKSAEKH